MLASASTLPERTGDVPVRPSIDGKTDVVDELYKHFKAEGVRFARRRGAEDPEGLFDQVFVDVMAKIDTLSEPTGDAFAAYLFRSIRNRVIQEYRRKPPPSVPLVEEIVETPRSESSFDDAVVEADFVETLLHQLTPAQRDVIVSRFLNGHNSVETAAVLNTSPDSVRQLQRSALRRLRFVLSVTVAIILIILALSALRNAGPEPLPSDPVQSTQTFPSTSIVSDGGLRADGSNDQQRALAPYYPDPDAGWEPGRSGGERAEFGAPARVSRGAAKNSKKATTTVPASSTSSSTPMTTAVQPVPATSTTTSAPAASPTSSVWIAPSSSSSITYPTTTTTTTTLVPPPTEPAPATTIAAQTPMKVDPEIPMEAAPTPPNVDGNTTGEDGEDGKDGTSAETVVEGRALADPEGLGTTTTTTMTMAGQMPA